MERSISLRKNPSRVSCENTIRRILMTEILETGKNEHFKTAADFMTYFESLYPASDGLTKQVQRAIRSMNMPRDERGYFIPNKTVEQVEQEKQMKYLFSMADAHVVPLEAAVPLFLKVEPHFAPCLLQTMEENAAFREKYITAVPAYNGIVFYTDCPSQLKVLLESMILS